MFFVQMKQQPIYIYEFNIILRYILINISNKITQCKFK